jgi:IPT/TIG domain
VPHSLTVRNPLPSGTAGVTIPMTGGGPGIPAIPGQTLILDDISFSYIPNWWFNASNSFGAAILLDNGMLNPGVPAPTLTSVAPTSAPHGTATAVTLTGTFLTGATEVLFNGVAGTGLSVTNATTVAVTTPLAAAAGPCVVQVVTPGGAATLSTGFTYT